MDNPKIKFAIAGYGHIGKIHADFIQKNPGCELVAVIDTRSKNELQLGPGIPFFNSLESFFQAGIVTDVVTIATPNGIHAEYAIKCLEQNMHVVIEKPMALNTVEAENILLKASTVKKYVFTVLQNRFSGPSIWLKDIVSSGRLGKIYIVQINCFWNRDERYYTENSWHGSLTEDGGTLFTQFSHFIDTMFWLFGDITNIKGKFMNFNHSGLIEFEDSGFINFDFVNGGAGFFNYTTSCLDKNLESSLIIIAENGTIKVSGQYMNEIDYCNIRDYPDNKIDTSIGHVENETRKDAFFNHNNFIKNILEKINDAEPVNSYDPLKVVEIIERIYKTRDMILNI